VNRWRAALVLASASLLTGGCVAAAIPVVAGGMIARGKLRDGAPERAERKKASAEQSQRARMSMPSEDQGTPTVTAMTELPPPSGASSPVRTSGSPASVQITQLKELPPPTGVVDDKTVASAEINRALAAHLFAQAVKRARGEPLRSVVLDAGATLESPRYVPCDAKPLAMLVDLDGNPDKSADPDARWRRWQGDGRDAIAAEPATLGAIDAARREGIAVILSSARSPEGSAGVVAALEQIGLGRVEPGKTLYLRGQASADATRRIVAASHCVIALIGDEPSDFSDLLPNMDEGAMQAAAVTDTKVAPLMGAGWFLLPNVVRSTATPSINPSGGN
jgi:hypothetical protein